MSRHIHFIGIGGIGMSGIAQLLLLKGEKVSGSDLKENANTKILQEQGAQIYIGHDAENVRDSDLVVYSSAVDFRNPELVCAVERHIPVLKRAEMLSELMSERTGITVSGAHGKTTTTSMISHLLTSCGLCPTVATGGIMQNSSRNSLLGEGKYFVAELDESDGSFLYFYPNISVVTNIDYEHVDYYGNWQNILDAFRKFLNQTHRDGLIVGCADDINISNILKALNRRSITYGLSERNEVFAKNILIKNLTSKFTCVYKGAELGEILLRVAGRHNISNSLACICVGRELGIDFEKIRETLSDFQGVERRFQIKAQVNGITVMEDYGHHPTEITATLRAAKDADFKRIVVVFQPHRYTRTKFLIDEFAKCFDTSDYLIITDIYAASEKPIDGVSAENITSRIKSSGKKDVFFVPRKEDIVNHLLKVLRDGDLALFLGAGDINKLADELAERIKQNN